jgi:hypothetical protein
MDEVLRYAVMLKNEASVPTALGNDSLQMLVGDATLQHQQG